MSEQIWIRSEDVSLALTEQGELCGLSIKGQWRDVTGETVVRQCEAIGLPDIRLHAADSADIAEVRRTWRHTDTGGECVVTDRFRRFGAGIEWQVEVAGKGEPWSAAIDTKLQYKQSEHTQYWTAWGDPDNGKLTAVNPAVMEDIANGTASATDLRKYGLDWSDPLAARPLEDRLLWYGAPYYRNEDPLVLYCPFLTDVFCLPMLSILEKETDLGFSVLLSPEDLILDLTLETGKQGDVAFSRLHHRISADNVLTFTVRLTAHEADWRGGLRAFAEQFPSFLHPANPRARDIAGTGAYSVNDAAFDADKMKRMAFKVNWKASFDFPYMGMFLPPVEEHENWERFGGGETSIAALRDYSARMAGMGFHVLNYFNVTEFGAKIQYPAPEASHVPADELWRDGNAYLHTKLADAILLAVRNTRPIAQSYGVIEAGRPFWSWEGAVAMDPGEPSYRQFLLEQARRHIAELPESSGICIDRMDWLRFYNDRRDDGVSWFDGQPARSLIVSWHQIIGELGNLFHQHGKVIYCNNHIKRVDVLQHIDGLFDEFTYAGAPLNTSAVLGVFKPVLGWVGDEHHLLPDPDAFFHKYLYLGVFPMAPFPGNDHSLGPVDWVDRYYLDYGPLLSAMAGKQWVLEPHVLEVEHDAAKGNMFRVEDGYVIPVVFGGSAAAVNVIVRMPGLRSGRWAYLHPGMEGWKPLAAHFDSDQTARLNVPLHRGCAMVRCFTDKQPGVNP